MVTCPECHGAIGADDVNVAQDVMFCRACEKPFPLSSLVHDSTGTDRSNSTVVPTQVDLASPPDGAWYRDDGLVIDMGATLRSRGGAIFLFVFSAIWNGVTWTRIIGLLLGRGASSPGRVGGTAANATSHASVGEFLFMTPFALVGIGTAFLMLYFIFGKVRIVIRGAAGSVATGFGPIVVRRRFNLAEVEAVSIERTSSGDENETSIMRVVLAGTGVTFGAGLTEARRAFIAGALRQLIGRG